jgi:hypothetical protein
MKKNVLLPFITATCSFGNTSPVYILFGVVPHPEVRMTRINGTHIEIPWMIDFGFMFDPIGFFKTKLHGGMLWDQIFILDSAYISRKFSSDPRLFSPENEEISTPPPCGLLIGIYLLYENWSTETFRKKESKKGDVCSTYLFAIAG